MLAREQAESEYERGHRVAGIGGTVTGFMFDPLMLISGGVGGSAVKGASWLAGRYAMLIGGALGLTIVSIFTAFNASKQLKEASDRDRKGKTESEGNEEDANGI